MKRERRSIFYVVLLTAAASFVYMMNCGIRNNFGIMLSAIVENAGLTFASVSFVLAVGQFCFGVTQPVFGIVADRKGSRFSLLCGIICSAAGVILIPFCKSGLTLMVVLGILLPGGLGAISFGVIMGTISEKIPEKIRQVVSGIVNASSGIGNTLLTPVISTAIGAGGILRGMLVLVVPVIAMIPVTVWMCGRNTSGKMRKKKNLPQEKPEPESSTLELFRRACKDRDYIFIVLGFFTCGFHMAIITNHLATEIVSYGYSYEESAYAFSVYGIATMVGALLTGMFCSRLKMKNVLGTLYGLRVVGIIGFLLLPKTMPVICAFIFLLGATGSATVTPVSGICGKIFGTRGVTIFFGLAFLVHQIGGFLSAWLGGICFECLGKYELIWIADAMLCTFAAVISYFIKKETSEK